jgi:fructose-bisphosphate aldolase class II
MRFVPLHEMLRACVRRPWAIGGFDTLTLEMTQGIFDAAAAERSPLIIMCLPGFTPAADMPGLIAGIREEAERAGVPACLHYDHATTLDQVAQGLRLGISGAMIDGSTLPLEENIALTRQTVEMCHRVGVGVEAELGHVGFGAGYVAEGPAQAEVGRAFTRVDEAVRFVEETGVDALAVAVGTVHGLYKGRPEIDFERLASLRAALDIPLVLHGGSDNPEGDMQRAVAVGIDKINIWTDIRVPYLEAVRDYLQATPPQMGRPDHMGAAARDAVCRVASHKMQLFGSSGRA